jgi:hypothetical protein
MLYSEFLKPYHRGSELPRQEDTVLQQAASWDNYFGKVLFDYIETGENTINGAQLTNYSNWQEGFLPYVLGSLSSAINPGGITNTHGFNILNRSLLYEWGLMVPDSQIRSHQISFQQDSLALAALHLYSYRNDFFKRDQTNDGPVREHGTILHGLLTEYDTAIVLLELQRRNREIQSVIPAPHIFESADDEHNCDFLVMTSDRVVGVQVKGRVFHKSKAKYDESRIVLVDGLVDMGNGLAKKVVGKSEKVVIGWGGIISAQRVTKLRSKGDSALSSELTQQQKNNVLRSKFLAKQLVGNIRSNYDLAVQRVGARVLPALLSET